MQTPLLSTLSLASLSATLLLVACTDGSTRRLDEGSDGGPGGVGGSQSGGSGGSGGSENPGPHCTGVETLCGSACCPNQTHVCNGGICEPNAETCVYGTTCATGKVCNSAGECRDGCFIDNTLHPRGAKNPSNQCESCEAASTTSWTQSAAEGAGCGGGKFCNATGKCGSGCVIGGKFYDIGAKNAKNMCQSCLAGSPLQWSNSASEGDSCGTGLFCDSSNECIDGCNIFGKVYPVGTQYSANKCKSCSASNRTQWSNTSVEGDSCGTGLFCNSLSECIDGCHIGGTVYPIGTKNAANKCKSCSASNRTQWTNSANEGDSCGTGLFCDSSNECIDGCYIGGTVYPIGTKYSANQCKSCAASNRTQWSNSAKQGDSCGTGLFCNSVNECIDGCYIGGTVYPIGTKNSANQCKSCLASNRTQWSNSANQGDSCGAGLFCSAGRECVAGCKIGGHVYDIGQHSPSGKCEVCSVANSTAWSQASPGDLCSDGGTVCRFDGKCVVAMSVAAGAGHTCGVTPAGRAMCWGFGEHGQLGNGGSSSSTTPVGVSGLDSGVVGITAGGNHSCAIKASGDVMCWGRGDNGQIGNGTGKNQSTPQLVVDLPFEAVSIAAGSGHTCAVLVDGTAMCWGVNSYGQLGDSTTVVRHSPVQVVGLPSAVASISAGGDHTCAILVDSSLWCWGYNGHGQLGNGTTTNSSTPLRPKNLANNIVSVAGGVHNFAGGAHTCAVSSDGDVRCWGSYLFGALGHPVYWDILEPGAPVAGLPYDVVGTTAGHSFSCAWSASGAAMCWGGGGLGELGDNKTASRHTPDFVYGLNSGVRALSAIGFSHACAIMQSGKVRCWGWNELGQIGDGSVGTDHLIPTELTLFP